MALAVPPASGEISLSRSIQEELDLIDIIEISKLEIGKELGRGAFGVVHTASYLGTEVAAKKIQQSSLMADNFEEDVKKEVNVVKQLRHPNVIQFMGYAKNEETGDFWIITQLAKGGSLRSFLTKGNVSWNQRLSILEGVVQGLLYVHEWKGILHRDIKAENILLDEYNRPLLCDFGLAATLKRAKHRLKEQVGTLWWRAPEMQQKVELSSKADIFSLGIFLGEVFTGEDGGDIRLSMTYQDKKDKNYFHVNSREYEETLLQYSVPPVLRDLFYSCCEEDPEKRPSLNHILETIGKAKEEFEQVISKMMVELKKLPGAYQPILLDLFQTRFNFNETFPCIKRDSFLNKIDEYWKERFGRGLTEDDKKRFSNALSLPEIVSGDTLTKCLPLLDRIETALAEPHILPFFKCGMIMGVMSRNDANQLLSSSENRTAVMRISPNQSFKICLDFSKDKQTMHYLIHIEKNGFRFHDKVYTNFAELLLRIEIKMIYPERELKSEEFRKALEISQSSLASAGAESCYDVLDDSPLI